MTGAAAPPAGQPDGTPWQEGDPWHEHPFWIDNPHRELALNPNGGSWSIPDHVPRPPHWPARATVAEPVLDMIHLQQRYAAVVQPPVSPDVIIDRLLTTSEDAGPERKQWLIRRVMAEGSNLVLVGDDKATKSTEMHELAITLTTATEHWGLAPFDYTGEPASVLLVQEENEHGVVMQDLSDIAVARGLPADTPDRLIVEKRLRIISRPGLNLLNIPTRTVLAYAGAGYDYLLIDSLDKMGVPETNASGELSDTLRFLTQLQKVTRTNVVLSWPFASRMRFDFDSTLGGDTLPRWWQGAMLLDWNDKTKTRRVKTCALRSRLGRHEFRLEGHGTGAWELKASAAEGEKLPTQTSVTAAETKKKVREMRDAGQSVKAIAKELGITERTAYRHLREAEK